MDELELLAHADALGRRYTETTGHRRVFPSDAAIAALAAFDEPLPERDSPAEETLALLDEVGSPATTASNGPRYFGFVIGAALPAAAAAERLMLAWDQCASTFDNSPVSATLERVAARWVLDALDLPRDSAVGFGTSATACTLTALAAARRELLARLGWDFDGQGLNGAPEIRVVISELAHITVKKALRVLGFGMNTIIHAPVDAQGRVDAARLPPLDERTILCLQAGEVNTGAFDPFEQIIPYASKVGAWVHVDGAFGLWARASSLTHLTQGIERADSWTTDAHKWLNTPYDCAMTICRDARALAEAMNSDAAYSSASVNAQKNLTLEFSRRPRGIPVWAALRSLGREGIAELVERHCAQARHIGDGLARAGFEVLNEVTLNQVLFRCTTDAQTLAVRAAVQASGRAWFGGTVWQERPAMRISVSSWRTQDADVEALLALLVKIGPAPEKAAT
ncbi:aspartate aminotransferase family protein [Klebsiella pneumoniae]|uniref:pyridoxal phosphate-dependent decarboxylase family protein n=1 Tax=Gammaproteobacteria TaxID=1236 RepID=UPI00071BE973|nr:MULTISPECIES: pyridoxal-dependent decarboxylase [Gammaproteobacteria]KSQ25158.1 aspartate aminotransferase family protein [Pseudomonas aeruginosa]MCY0067436.1 aspartate aminotransferase family protein [Klebsiella pneumoniae]HEM6677860.1 aspartate aminotransferase family protein [Citrobacter amalonaticus]